MKERRSYSIYREAFRLRIIRTLLGVLLGVLVVLILLGLSLFYWIPAGKAIFSQGGIESPAAIYIILIGKIMLVLSIILVLLLIWSIYIVGSKFLGPIRRISIAMEKMDNTKQLKELRFRKGDEWEFHSLASNINIFMKELQLYRGIGNLIIKANKMIEKDEISSEKVIAFVKKLKEKIERSS